MKKYTNIFMVFSQMIENTTQNLQNEDINTSENEEPNNHSNQESHL